MTLHNQYLLTRCIFFKLTIIFFLAAFANPLPVSNSSDFGYLPLRPYYEVTGVRFRNALENEQSAPSDLAETYTKPVYSPGLQALSEPCIFQGASGANQHNSLEWVRQRASTGASSSAFCYSFHRSHAQLTWSEAVFHCRALRPGAGSAPNEHSTQIQMTRADGGTAAGAELLWLSASDLAEAQWVVRAARAVASDLGNGGGPTQTASHGPLLLLNAHRYIYNASGPAWANGELLAGKVAANGTAAESDGQDLVCHTHTADNETVDCYALELSGRTSAIRCTEPLQDALVVCKIDARQYSQKAPHASGVVSPTAGSQMSTPPRSPIVFPRPPHCVDTISSSTADVSRFGGSGWTERRMSPGLSAFYYQDPASRPATWVRAYHSCRSLGADLLWLENVEEARWVHERAREWADASRFRFRLLLMHEYLFGAAAGNRWVDGTAVARPQADAVRAPGRHSFLDPKTLRYLKIMSGNEAFCGKLRLDEIFDSADIVDENCTCTSKWLENLFICKVKVFRAQPSSTARRCAPATASSALTRATTDPQSTSANLLTTTATTTTPTTTTTTKSPDALTTTTNVQEEGRSTVAKLWRPDADPPSFLDEWDRPRITPKPTRLLRVLTRTPPRLNTIAPVTRSDSHVSSLVQTKSTSDSRTPNVEHSASSSQFTDLVTTTQKAQVRPVVEVRGAEGNRVVEDSEWDRRFRSIISPVLALIVILLFVALVLACVVGTVHICCRSSCCWWCCLPIGTRMRRRPHEQEVVDRAQETGSGTRQNGATQKIEEEKQRVKEETGRNSCWRIGSSFLRLSSFTKRGRMARSESRTTGEDTKGESTALVLETGCGRNGAGGRCGQLRVETGDEAGSRDDRNLVCDQNTSASTSIYDNVAPLFGTYPLTELPPPNGNASPKNSLINFSSGHKQEASTANANGKRIASASDSGVDESPSQPKETALSSFGQFHSASTSGAGHIGGVLQMVSFGPTSLRPVQPQDKSSAAGPGSPPKVPKHEFPCHPAVHSNAFPSHPFAKKDTSGVTNAANAATITGQSGSKEVCDSAPELPPHQNAKSPLIATAAINKLCATNSSGIQSQNESRQMGSSPKKQSPLAAGSPQEAAAELSNVPQKSASPNSLSSARHPIRINGCAAGSAAEAAAVEALSAETAASAPASANVERVESTLRMPAERPHTTATRSPQCSVPLTPPAHANNNAKMCSAPRFIAPPIAYRPAGAAAGGVLGLSESSL